MFDVSAKRLFRLLATLRHLRAQQIVFLVWRRGIGARTIEPWREAPRQRDGFVDETTTVSNATTAAPDGYVFNFLNLSQRFAAGAMDWCPRNVPRLWRYNLHYFDFLKDRERPFCEKAALLDDWIANNPQGAAPAWEPYPTSLRIVNWCQFLGSLPPSLRRAHWVNSLYDQARWLERNQEHHILANHFFENLKALLFAGVFFADDKAQRWLHYSQRALLVQLREQILADGGHYERSPLYHCIILDGCLDLYRLACDYPGLFQSEFGAALHRQITAMLDYLAAIATPNDEIPLFNDSANGIAPTPRALAQRAERLGFVRTPAPPALIDRPASGLYGWKSAGDFFLIDCGDIGPSYQPGHTHCDFLSYVLMLDRQWLIVDSGVCEYEPGAMRRYVRSTEAHNTVAVDGEEQSELWGEFRVGRRAERLDARIAQTERQVLFEGTYRGFLQLGGIEHHREARLQLDQNGLITGLSIADRLQGTGSRACHSYIHLHPALHAAIRGANIDIQLQGRILIRIHTTGVDNIHVLDRWYCPEFGLKLPSKVLQLTRSGSLPIRFGYTISVVGR